jgi:adenine-specific DNA-methyltransferase
MSQKYDDLVKKLREIFQIDKPDLDFGIYRIINQRAGQINDYLTHTLREKVETEIGKRQDADFESKRNELMAQLRDEFGKRAFDDAGNLTDPEALASNLGKELEALDKGTASNAEHENAVFSHLLTFFARYYDKGDFISQRRYKGDTYAIPYSGEEVMLHWANKDQYYIKSGETFSNYTFRLEDGRKVHFRLVTADTAKDNRKDNDKNRCFALAEARTVMRTDEDGEDYEEAILPIEELEAIENGKPSSEMVLRFEYIPVDKGTKQADLIAQALELVSADATVKAKWLDLSKRMPTEANPQRTALEKYLTDYTSKNTSDYFIHKNLEGFLRNELDFYIKNEVMHLDDVQEATKFADIEKNLRIIQCLRAIGQELIRFLAQIENFQKKLWLKKKFVVETNYCITLDRLFAAPNSEALIAAVLEHCETKIRRYDGELRSQRDEWVKLYRIDELEDYPKDGPLTEAFLRGHDKMMVDTVFYPQSFKWQLLGSIHDLDASLDGLILHSENFQALNLMHERYREKVKCVYIDPPYNTEADRNTGKFIYKDSFARSSWISFFMDRLQIGKSLHQSDSLFFTSIDENEVYRLGELLETNQLNRIGIFTWVKKRKGSHLSKTVRDMTEYILAYANPDTSIELYGERAYSEKAQPLAKRTNKHKTLTFLAGVVETTLQDGVYNPGQYGSGTSAIEFPKGFEVKNTMVISDFTAKGPFVWTQDTLDAEIGKGSLVKLSKKFGFNVLRSGQADRIKRPSTLLDSKAGVGTNEEGNEEILSLFAEEGIASYPKPSALIAYLTNSVTYSHKDALILDYFAGSGTTAHAVINLNREDDGSRKYILVEVGDHFDTVLKPRIQKVVYSKDWKDGKPLAGASSSETLLLEDDEEISGNSGISHAFKYLRLESYEDTLNNLELKRAKDEDLFSAQVKQDYLLKYMLDVESKDSLLSIKDFNKPFDYTLKIATDSAGAYESKKVDLVETFNYLIGLRVKHIDAEIERGYLTVEGTLPTEERCLVLWRDCEQVEYEALTKLCEKLQINPKDSEYDVVYINGDHNIPTLSQEMEDEGGITRSLKLRQIEPEFLQRMFEVEDV